MHDNRRFISGSKIYTKTTILESVVEKSFGEYTVNHYFKEIVKKNDGIDQTVDEKTNWEDDKLSADLNDKKLISDITVIAKNLQVMIGKNNFQQI